MNGLTVHPSTGSGRTVKPCLLSRLKWVALTRTEVREVLARMNGVYGLMANMLYGTGMRLMECVRLRVKDVDFERGEILIREGKGVNKILKALGIQAQNKKDYNTQFGISLNKPNLQPIVNSGSHFMAGATSDTSQNTESLLTQLQTAFDIQEGEVDMLIMNMPNMPPQQAPVIMMVKATQPSTKELYGTVGDCVVVDNTKRASIDKAENSNRYLAVRGTAWNIFHMKDPNYSSPGYDSGFRVGNINYSDINTDNALVTILQQPKHGTLSKDLSRDISYYPDAGYSGKDKAIFLVNMEGYNIKVVYYFDVVDFNKAQGTIKLWEMDCPGASPWMITSTANLTDVAYSLSLPAAFLGSGFASPSITFTNLIGETQGSGTNATITLDTDAAGHGWYIDYTPYLNDGFLPTSNPNEWVAKTGSSAAGKMKTKGSSLVSCIFKPIFQLPTVHQLCDRA